MKKLEFLSGQGYEYSKENGKFEVKYGNEYKIFIHLSEAKKFYKSLNEEKSIWDITNMPELLECHVFSNQ